MFKLGPKAVFRALLTAYALLALPPELSSGASLDTVGAVEEVLLLPWKVKFSARIDTGAAQSSLHAPGLKVTGNQVEFTIPDAGKDIVVKLPLRRWLHIRTSEGNESRPEVRMEICIGSRKLSTLVNLNDRSRMEYRLVIGRLVLAGRFIVDVGRQKLLTPNCQKDGIR